MEQFIIPLVLDCSTRLERYCRS